RFRPSRPNAIPARFPVVAEAFGSSLVAPPFRFRYPSGADSPPKWLTPEKVVMDDTRCRRFFLQPTSDPQRLYEALHAVFVDGCRQKEAAERFGLGYDAFRQQVGQFRAACAPGPPPPFPPPARAGAPRPPPACRGIPSAPPSPTAASATWHRATVSRRAWPASSCSYHCSPECSSIVWSVRPATPAPR